MSDTYPICNMGRPPIIQMVRCPTTAGQCAPLLPEPAPSKPCVQNALFAKILELPEDVTTVDKRVDGSTHLKLPDFTALRKDRMSSKLPSIKWLEEQRMLPATAT